MPDNKLTDNEIIKALECCTTNGASCKDCPAFVKVDRSNCKKYFRGALDLINRLQAKNERLRKECGNQSNLWSNHYEGLYQIALGTIKPKAYKEFAELVQGEIDDALHSNYNAKEERYENCKKHGIPIDAEDSFLMYCDGKIHALSGLQSFVSNTLKELVGDK